MAEAGQQKAVTAAFAPPPPLWRRFTADNVNKLEEIKKQAATDGQGRPRKIKWSPAELRALDVPPELRFLVPPEIPSDQYNVFGEVQNVRPSITSVTVGVQSYR